MAARKTGQALLLAFGSPVELSDATPTESGLRWVHNATEGSYAGYRGGKAPFQFTRELFEQTLLNFRANPQYLAGPDGVGSRPVVPWDYEHASEHALALPSVAQHGAPATGWAYELDIRNGPDGKAQLWSLTEFVGEAATQVATKQYKWSSVAIRPVFINPVTGKDQGSTLTSIALTNKPFLQGLEPIAATLDQYGTAETPLEVLVGLRDIFRLPREGDPNPDAVLAQLQMLSDMIASGSAPGFVDVEDLFRRLSSLLGLPILTAPQAIVDAAMAAVRSITNPGEASQPAPATQTQGVVQMSFSPQQLAKLAIALKSSDATEEAILLAADKNAAAAQSQANAIDQLRSILGGEDFAAMLANATKLATDAAKLAPALEQLSQLQGALKGVAENEAENEAETVAASMASGNQALKAQIKGAIVALRKSAIRHDGTTDETILATFRSTYADHLKAPEPQRQLLTSRLVAGPHGMQLGGAPTMGGSAPILASAGASNQSPDATVLATINAINASPGSNEIERANSYLCSQDAAHRALPRIKQIPAAGRFLRELTGA